MAAFVIAVLATVAAEGVSAQDGAGKPVYRCPGTPVLYTDALTPQQARERGCTVIESAPVTVIQGPKPRPAVAASAPARPASDRVDPALQRERDSDARRILSEELRREQERLAELRREYNNGQPERLGSERNYQRYLDRVAEMKAAVARKEADIAAIQRELGKLQP